MDKPRDLFHSLGLTCAGIGRIIGRTGSAVSQWKRVPAEHVLAIEAGTECRVTRWDMRPDVFGSRNNGLAA